MKILKKISNNPVGSKIIVKGLLALLSLIPIGIWRVKIIAFFNDIILKFIDSHYVELLFIVMFVTIVILSLVIILPKIRKSNKVDMKWFSSFTDADSKDYIFLLWFPLNGVLVSPSLEGDYERIKSIRNSVLIIDLLEHNIIKFEGLSTIRLNRSAYDFLQKKLKEIVSSDEEVEQLKIGLNRIKKSNFSNMIGGFTLSNNLGI